MNLEDRFTMRQGSLIMVLAGIVFLAGAIALCATAIPQAIRNGGVPISHKDGSPDSWMPLPMALLVFALMILFFSGGGVYLALRGLFRRIAVDSSGIVCYDWLNRITDEAAWVQVHSVKALCDHQRSGLRLLVAGGSVDFSFCLSKGQLFDFSLGSIWLFVNALRNHLPDEVLQPILQPTAEESVNEAKIVPTAASFRYSFPFSAALRLGFGIAVLTAIMVGYRFDPVVFCLDSAMAAAFAGVVFVWARTSVTVDGHEAVLRRAWGAPVVLPFEEIVAIVGGNLDYLPSGGSAPGSYVVIGPSGLIRMDSYLVRQQECIDMIRRYMPGSALVIPPLAVSERHDWAKG